MAPTITSLTSLLILYEKVREGKTKRRRVTKISHLTQLTISNVP